MGNSGENNTSAGSAARPDTLERLLSHCALLHPQKLALCDPPNRNALERREEDLPARRYNFLQLDNTVSRIARLLQSTGLHPGDYIGLQLPNFIEAPIMVLACMRAGFVPCLLPLSWSSEDLARSTDRLKPVVLFSSGQLGGVNHSEGIRELAFANIHVRFVMGSGHELAEGISDLSALFTPVDEDVLTLPADPLSDNHLNDLALVTYIDPITPVPHSHGQILSGGLLHVLEFGLSSSDHILSTYPLSSIPGLVAHMYPWLLAGCTLSLHHPFQFDVLQRQLQTEAFSFFAAPQLVIEGILRNAANPPQKLVIVRRDAHLSLDKLQASSQVQLFDLWNLGGLGSVPVKYSADQIMGLFREGRICLPSDTGEQLCLAGAKIMNNRLFVKGRIFPGPASVQLALEWFTLKKRFDQDWLDTGLAAFHGADNSILLGRDTPEKLQKVAS